MAKRFDRRILIWPRSAISRCLNFVRKHYVFVEGMPSEIIYDSFRRTPTSPESAEAAGFTLAPAVVREHGSATADSANQATDAKSDVESSASNPSKL